MQTETKRDLVPFLGFCTLFLMGALIVLWIHLNAGFTLAFMTFVIMLSGFFYWRGRQDERSAFQSGARTAAELQADSAALTAWTASRVQDRAKDWDRYLRDRESSLNSRERSLEARERSYDRRLEDRYN